MAGSLLSESSESGAFHSQRKASDVSSRTESWCALGHLQRRLGRAEGLGDGAPGKGEDLDVKAGE